MAPLTLYLESSPTPTLPSKLDPYIATNNFPNPSPASQFQDTPTSQYNSTPVAWVTLEYKKLTMDNTSSEITMKYCDHCEWTLHLAYACCKRGLTFIPPHIHQYNLKNG